MILSVTINLPTTIIYAVRALFLWELTLRKSLCDVTLVNSKSIYFENLVNLNKDQSRVTLCMQAMIK